ncbi:MAG: hypothetical protein AB7V26_01610 [Lysobacterales bacterium]
MNRKLIAITLLFGLWSAASAYEIGTIDNGYIGAGGANLRALRIEAGQPVAYPFEFAADTDGVWRIDSL